MKRTLFAAAGLLLASLPFAATPAQAAAARNYDCTKSGNANKAVCKSAAAPAPTVAKAATTTVTKTARNYDCTKAGNANKTVCKGMATTTVSRPTPGVPPPRPAPAAPVTRGPVSGQNTNPGGPSGATAKCRDGSYSHSAHRSGTCARHGGVAQWY